MGRVLTGLDPTGLDFDCIPPHFGLDNPMGNPHVKRAMNMTFGDFLDEHPNFTRILFRCLASIVHHKNALIDQMHRVPGHHFNNITVLQEPDLLGELEQLITTKPSAVISSSTGILPHVETNRNLTTIIGDLSDVLELQKGVDATISDAMGKTLED